MISSLMSALAPRVAYGPAGAEEPSGSGRFSTAVNVSDAVGEVTAPAANARASSGGPGSGGPGSGGPGDGEAGFSRGSRPAGAYVPPLNREPEDGSGDPAAHPLDETPLEAAMPATRWMSAAMPQPDAVSFAGSEPDATDAAFAAERRSNLDYLVASMKSMQESARDSTPAMRHAVAAYGDV